MSKVSLKKKVPTPIIRAPRGYRFEIDDTEMYDNDCEYCCAYVYVHLVNSKTNIDVGTISLEQVNKNTFRTHSQLDSKLHGKGLGTLLYAKAIQWCHRNGYRVRSSGCSSDMAARVWRGNGIRKLYKIYQRATPSSPSRTTWYAHSRAQA